MWGDRFGERQKPDLRFPLLAILAVEFLEDLLSRFGRAEHLVEQGQCRLIQWQRGQFRSCSKADSRLLQRYDRVHLRQRREWFVFLQIGEQFLGLFLERCGFLVVAVLLE